MSFVAGVYEGVSRLWQIANKQHRSEMFTILIFYLFISIWVFLWQFFPLPFFLINTILFYFIYGNFIYILF